MRKINNGFTALVNSEEKGNEVELESDLQVYFFSSKNEDWNKYDIMLISDKDEVDRSLYLHSLSCWDICNEKV